MSEDKKKAKNGYIREFRGSKLARIFWRFLSISSILTFCGLGIFLVTVIATSNMLAWCIWGVYSVVMMYTAFAGFWAAKARANHKMVVTSEGILLHYFGIRFYTWDSLIELELIHSLLFSVWVINTIPPEIEVQDQIYKHILRKGWGYADTFIQLPIMHRSIRDKEKFKETEFGQDLYHYAPHLFEDYNEWKPKKLKHAIMEERSIEQEAFSDEQAQKKTQKR